MSNLRSAVSSGYLHATYRLLQREISTLQEDAKKSEGRNNCMYVRTYVCMYVCVYVMYISLKVSFIAAEVQCALWSVPTLTEGLEIINKMDPHNRDGVKLVPGNGIILSLMHNSNIWRSTFLHGKVGLPMISNRTPPPPHEHPILIVIHQNTTNSFRYFS